MVLLTHYLPQTECNSVGYTAKSLTQHYTIEKLSRVALLCSGQLNVVPFRICNMSYTPLPTVSVAIKWPLEISTAIQLAFLKQSKEKDNYSLAWPSCPKPLHYIDHGISSGSPQTSISALTCLRLLVSVQTSLQASFASPASFHAVYDWINLMSVTINDACCVLYRV